MPRTYGQISVMSVGAKDKPKKIEGSVLTLFNIENDPATRVDRFMELLGRF